MNNLKKSDLICIFIILILVVSIAISINDDMQEAYDMNNIENRPPNKKKSERAGD